MSWGAVKWVVSERRNASSAVRRLSQNGMSVLLALADHHSFERGCWPSQGTIADLAGISRASVNRALDEIERLGLVRRIRGAAGRSTRYLLAIAARWRPAGAPVEEADPSDGVCLTVRHARVSRCDTNLNQIDPSPKPPTAAPSGGPGAGDLEFSEFWDACPNRVDRDRTWRAWRTVLRKGARAADLIAAMKAFAAAKAGTDVRFLRHPANWLHDHARPGPAAPAAPAPRHADPLAVARFWAEAIKARGYIPQSAISPRTVVDMIDARLVTPDDLRAVGISIPDRVRGLSLCPA